MELRYVFPALSSAASVLVTAPWTVFAPCAKTYEAESCAAATPGSATTTTGTATAHIATPSADTARPRPRPTTRPTRLRPTRRLITRPFVAPAIASSPDAHPAARAPCTPRAFTKASK